MLIDNEEIVVARIVAHKNIVHLGVHPCATIDSPSDPSASSPFHGDVSLAPHDAMVESPLKLNP